MGDTAAERERDTCDTCGGSVRDGFCRACDTLELVPAGREATSLALAPTLTGVPRCEHPHTASRAAVSRRIVAVVGALLAVAVAVNGALAVQLQRARDDVTRREAEISALLYSSKRSPSTSFGRSVASADASPRAGSTSTSRRDSPSP
jgi:hypothetical protein